MHLIITEKPSVGQTIASVLGAKQRGDGYYEGGGYLVSWCVGHLIELAQADAYDEKYGKWRYEDLPIIPDGWKYAVSKGKEKQVKILAGLMKRADVDQGLDSPMRSKERRIYFDKQIHKRICYLCLL